MTDGKSSVVNEKIASLIKSHKTVFEVDIEKRSNGLGLSLVGGKDSDVCYEGNLCISAHQKIWK